MVLAIVYALIYITKYLSSMGGNAEDEANSPNILGV